MTRRARVIALEVAVAMLIVVVMLVATICLADHHPENMG